MTHQVALLRISRGAKHGHDVERGLVPQRIMHDVKAGAAPQHDIVASHACRHMLHRHDGAMGDVADETRRTFLEHLRSDRRAEPISANHSVSFEYAAILAAHAHTLT